MLDKFRTLKKQSLVNVHFIVILPKAQTLQKR